MDALGNRGKCAQPCRLPYKLIEKRPDSTNQSVIDQGLSKENVTDAKKAVADMKWEPRY